MLGLASKIRRMHGGGTRGCAVPHCLTFRRDLGRREMRAKCAFVSGVSLVSDNLELIIKGCRDVDGRKGIIVRIRSSAETGETGSDMAHISSETTGLDRCELPETPGTHRRGIRDISKTGAPPVQTACMARQTI
jgi:hypothetical protein